MRSPPTLPDEPPLMHRKPDCPEEWPGDGIGPGVGIYADSTARYLVDRDYVRAGRRWLIHAGGKFFVWGGGRWEQADRDALQAKIWGLLARWKQPTEQRVRAVMYALKIDTVWPPVGR